MTKKYKVRDLRIKEKYSLDDNYLNGYARVCGVYGTAVYNSLSRHADKNQYCFPNIDLMAKQHGCSKPSIIKGIKKLEEYNIIYVHRERTKSGTWRNNGYDLLDKSLWKNNQVNNIELDTKSTSFTSPSKRGLPDQVNDIEHKETHIKETHIKDKTSGKKEKVKKEKKWNEEDEELVKILHNTILERYPHLEGKFNFEKDCEEMNKLHRLDGWTYKQIEYVAKWSQEDQFWRQNIRSVSNLRKHFDKLIIKIKEQRSNNLGVVEV